MDKQTAKILCRLTSDFYRCEAASFSQTRNHPWPGWRQCLEAVEGLGVSLGGEASSECAEGFRVLDVACGNMRFERFLLREISQVKWNFCAVDNCDDLAMRAIGDLASGTADAVEGVAADAVDCALADLVGGTQVRYVHSDVMGELLAGSPLACVSAEAGEKPFDIAVAFGFMHHIPGFENRRAFLRALTSLVRPGGYVAVSFWRFMSEEKLASKAVETTERALRIVAGDLVSAAADGSMDAIDAGLTGAATAGLAGAATAGLAGAATGGLAGAATGSPTDAASTQLEENDYLLGWRDSQEVFRYCHHFSEEEIDGLADAVADMATVAARFHADGRTGDLNAYLVLCRS